MTKDPATDSGLNVRLVAAFAGWKGIPWLCWAHSDLSPRLVLHADRVEFRVIRTRSKPYSSISRVDYRKWHYTENIVLEFTDSLTTFIGNTMNPATARQAIRYLQEKGCPLSERASATWPWRRANNRSAVIRRFGAVSADNAVELSVYDFPNLIHPSTA